MASQTIHGRFGIVYLQGAGAGGVQILQARSWKFTMDTDLVEVSTFGSPWKLWLPNPMKWEGTVEGNFDTGDTTPWDAVQGTATGFSASTKAIALYPNRANLSHFYAGFIWPKLSVVVDMKNVSRFTLDFTGNGALAVT